MGLDTTVNGLLELLVITEAADVCFTFAVRGMETLTHARHLEYSFLLASLVAFIMAVWGEQNGTHSTW